MSVTDALVAFGYPRLDRKHRWGWCTECGAPSIVTRRKPTKKQDGESGRPPCRITPHCEGRHVPAGEKP